MEPKLMEIAIKQGKRQESKTSSRSPGGFVSFSSIWIMDTPALFLKNTKNGHSNFVFKLTSIIISFNIYNGYLFDSHIIFHSPQYWSIIPPHLFIYYTS